MLIHYRLSGSIWFLLAGFLYSNILNACPFELPVWMAEVNGQQLQLEVAESFEARQCGLSGRTTLAPERGMLFIFPRSMPVIFWMPDMKFPLSIAFLDEERRIVSIQAMTPEQTDNLYRSPGPVSYAIEVNRGWFSRHKVRIGDIVHMPHLSGKSQ